MAFPGLRPLVAALCLSCCGLLAACGGTRAHFPTAAELQTRGVAFSPSAAPSTVLSAASARNDQLTTHGGNWDRFPSNTYLERFGYLNADSAAVAPCGGNCAAAPLVDFHNVPAWEIAFGGVHLEPIVPFVPNEPSQKVVVVWHDDTVFVDATTGEQLLEVWNHCAPCSSSSGQHA